jgi:methionyl-tRNA formyltransferase
MKVLILGRTEYLYDTAELLSKSHTVCGIITAAAMPEYDKNENDFKSLAEKLGSPYLFSNTINDDVKKFIQEANADVCISLNWKTVLKDDIISLFPHGILNAHFGDLPSYRGNAVINWAILNNEQSIAVTVHQMVPGEIDSGAVYCKKYMELGENTTIGEVVAFCRVNTPLLFLEAVNGIENGTAKPVQQSELTPKPFRCYPRVPEYSKIDWTKSAREIHALVRASGKPYSGAYSYMKINGEIKKVYIWKTSVIADSTDDIGEPGHVIKNDNVSGFSHVLTGKGIIAIEEAQYENEETFLPGKVWKTIRLHFGIDTEEEMMNIYKLLNKK